MRHSSIRHRLFPPGEEQHPLEAAYAEHTRALGEQGLRRQLPRPSEVGLIDFSHNDYLGLSRHPRVLRAAQLALQEDGVGATGSRLLSGNSARVEALEARIAADKDCEAALVFGTGFQANTMVLAALLHPKIHARAPRVLADTLIHASMHQGCRLAGVQPEFFRHNDLDHLQSLLEAGGPDAPPTFVLSETVFGMDGDVLDMERLSTLVDAHNAMFYLDEAHATGVVGEQGYGLAGPWMRAPSGRHRGVVMGTFSKALGGMGAYVACSANLRNYFLHRCVGFIYTTAPSPAVVGAAAQAWEMVGHLREARHALMARAQRLREALTAQGWDCGVSTTHIVPIIVGDEDTTLALKRRLAEQGIEVSAVRPPTVPRGSSRLRVALAASHTDEQVGALVRALEDARTELMAGVASRPQDAKDPVP